MRYAGSPLYPLQYMATVHHPTPHGTWPLTVNQRSSTCWVALEDECDKTYSGFHRIEIYRYRSFEQLVQEQECMLFFKASIYLSLYLRRIVREHIDCPLLQIGPRFWAKVLQAAPKSRKMAQVTDTPFNKRTQFGTKKNTIRSRSMKGTYP